MLNDEYKEIFILNKNPYVKTMILEPSQLINMNNTKFNEQYLPMILNFKSNETSQKNPPQIFRYLLIILLIMIIFVGIFGNMLNLLIFSKKKMRQVSTFRFLLYISMSDLLVLLVGATQFLINAVFNFDFRSYSLFICKGHTFLTCKFFFSSY